MSTWPADAVGVITLADGRVVRGRGLRAGLPEGPEPTFGLYLLGRKPAPTAWPSWWVRWPDFRTPRDADDATDALHDAFARAATERVEVACGGGTGRTGTALAALAVLSGVSPDEAVAFVRARYRRRAVETRAQGRFVRTFCATGEKRDT